MRRREAERINAKPMNESKREKVVHCWENTGLLDVWDGEKRARLLQEALPQLDWLFRNSDNGHVDVSGTQSIDDDKGAEEAAGIDSNVKNSNQGSVSHFRRM